MAPARVGACRDGGSSARDAQRPPTRDSVTTLSVRIGPSVCRSVCRSRRQTEVRSGDVLVGKDRASPSGAAACCHAVPSSSGSEFARNHVVTGSIPGTSSMCGRRGPQVDFVAHPDPSPTPPVATHRETYRETSVDYRLARVATGVDALHTRRGTD
jgi:hypothetical protein